MYKIEELRSYYEINKHISWEKWLEVEQIFDKPGKQGLVGIFKSKTNGMKYVFKISQYINYLVQHESVVMNGLNSISEYCPHYCKYIGTILCNVNPHVKKVGNPFITEGIKYTIQKEVLLCEYIENSYKLYNYIKSENIPEDVIYSTIKQVLLSINIAQRKKSFSHYDLHSNNIMMKKCNKDLVFLYVMDNDNQFCVPTNGYYPVIIDFGFAYIEDIEDGPLWPSMAHTDAGFMSDRFDWVADPKLFLVTVSGELKDRRSTKRSCKLRRVVKNIFYPLKIDWHAGWDNVEKKGASDYITQMLLGYSKVSRLFKDYEHHCIDILQSLVITPIQEENYSDIHISYGAFIKEWIKIENQIESSFYNLYILKCIVDSARYVRAAYNDPETSKVAISTFRSKVLKTVDHVAKFCNIKDIHYERLLCSLIVLARCIEGILYDVITSRMIEKNKEYDRLPLKSIEQIYGAIETNIHDNYVYNSKTTVCIIDSRGVGRNNLYTIPKDKLTEINSIRAISRGTYIWDLIK
jgi:hypothetical protein